MAAAAREDIPPMYVFRFFSANRLVRCQQLFYKMFSVLTMLLVVHCVILDFVFLQKYSTH